MTSQRIGKYACLELEKRYLLCEIPTDLDLKTGWQIVDRYIPDTRLRLRKMQSLTDGTVIYKLTQKYQSDQQDATQTTITNIYLNVTEYSRFESLEALILQKKRYNYGFHDRKYSLDIFDGRHAGLILAEIEFEDKSQLSAMGDPAFALKDVTSDPFFNGGRLAAVSDELFKQQLAVRLAISG